MWPDPIRLSGSIVTLEPLTQAHHDDLAAATDDGQLWKTWVTIVPTPAAMHAEIDRRLGLQAQGSMLPFAVISHSTGKAVGMTTYMNIEPAHRRVEIGSTWYAKSVQRSGLNTECKRLLLGHAFDLLDCIAVELRTHFFNRQSRRAIERIGARLDGILRCHQLGRDGTLRDTCVYSIIASEWPTVKLHLNALLADPRQE